MKTRTLIIVLLVTTCLYSTIINVPADQPTIQEGIVAAVDTDTVLVADGTYFENIDFLGKAITVASNFLINADTLHIANTIINGSQPANPDYGSVVTFMSNEDTTSVITGFTLTEGSGTIYSGIGLCGGGIICDNSSPKMVSNIVTNNSTDYSSGVGIVNNSSPILLSNVISYNTAAFNSAGVSIYTNCDAYLEGNIISNNTANDHCGGMLISDSSPTLVGNIIRENIALNGDDGGILIQLDSSPILKNNIICNNIAEVNGGGIEIYYTSATSLIHIENCTIYGNEASGNGSQINCQTGELEVVNSIISGSTTNGSVYFNTSTPTFNYCDFYNSDGPDFDGPSVPTTLGVITTVNNNDDPCDEFMNIFLEPLFVDSVNDDFHLTEFSPCIDAGNPDPIYYDPEDPGNPGYALYPAMGTIINDMGAYGGPNTIGWPVVGVEDNLIVQTPEVFLHQNYPNPFNPTTTINYSLKEDSKVSLNIYNIKGQKVKQLVSDQLSAGQHSVIWNGTDNNSKSVSSGIYFYKLKTENHEETKKMILMK